MDYSLLFGSIGQIGHEAVSKEKRGGNQKEE
jgi:hypothetical protein